MTENKRLGSKVYAVDFDGTLCHSTWPGLGEPNQPLIQRLKELSENGCKLILWTCREGALLEQAVGWCREQGLEFDAVNDNLPERVRLYGSNSRKISCDLYIDDKSYLPDDFMSYVETDTEPIA